MKFEIDHEFEERMPKLTEEELEQLEQNILSDGKIRDPLVIWNGIILDGHNRYRILQKHPGLPYWIQEIDLPDRAAAIAWICRNQLGRRNLTPEQKKYLIGKQYEAEKASRGYDGVSQTRDCKGQFHRSGQNDHIGNSGKTRERIAKEHNVSDSYVRRAEAFSRGVDAADEILPGIREEILTGSIKPTDQAVAEVGKADEESREKLARKLRKPRDPIMRQILEISESMLHSEGIAAATDDDVICEMKDALESLIWRWNNVKELYVWLLKKEPLQKRIMELVEEANAFITDVGKGAMWSDNTGLPEDNISGNI